MSKQTGDCPWQPPVSHFSLRCCHVFQIYIQGLAFPVGPKEQIAKACYQKEGDHSPEAETSARKQRADLEDAQADHISQ